MREKTIMEHLGLVFFISQKYQNMRYEREDIISVGTIGLIKAVDSFDYDRNVQFYTYAARCIENEIGMYLRKQTHQYLLSYVSRDPDQLWKEDEQKELIEKEHDLMLALNKLSGEKRKIIVLRYGLGEEMSEGLTQQSLAGRLGISQTALSRKEKKILTELRKLMKSERN